MPEIVLSRGLKSIIDEDDLEKVSKYKWCTYGASQRKYAHTTINKKHQSLHRLIMNVFDPKVLVDHINGNGLDNRKSNLRLTDHVGNARNVCKVGKLKGTCWSKKTKKWSASIKIHGKSMHLGFFNDEISAAHAYNEAAIKYFGEFANLNILKD